jgi:hypothetical protein
VKPAKTTLLSRNWEKGASGPPWLLSHGMEHPCQPVFITAVLAERSDIKLVVNASLVNWGVWMPT